MTNEVLTERRDTVFIVTLNRPVKGNAMTFDMANQLFNILKPVTTDRGVHAVLIKGAGGNFMDGLEPDLFFGDFNACLERATAMMQPYHSAIRELMLMDKPVLAVADGMTAGPGMSIMLACDLVIASRSAKFNCKFALNGITPDGGCSHTLTRKVGALKAAELLMLSDTFDAAEAERWNLINKVVDDDKLQEESMAFLNRLANGPIRAYGGIKKLVAKAFEQDVHTQLALEHTYWGASARSFDFREAVRAHQAKRPAKFTGS